MSAQVLLNLLDKLVKRYKISLFRSEFNKFNITGAQIICSIFHMTLKLLPKITFWHENVKILSFFTQH